MQESGKGDEGYVLMQVTQAGLASLAPLTALASLDLRNCEQVTGAGLASMTHLMAVNIQR